MNSPEHPDPALTAQVQGLPPPVLRDPARQRSLAAALAVLEETTAAPPPPRRRLLRMGRAQWSALAACWTLVGYFHLSAPGGPKSAGPSSAGGYAAWPGPFHPAPDEETAQLLAALYPNRSADPP